MEEVKSLEYFKKKLKALIKRFNEKDTLTINDREIRDNLQEMYNEIEEHILKDKTDKAYAYKKYFTKIINDLNEEIDFNKNQKKPIKTDFKPFNERAYSKLNSVFRKQPTLSNEQGRNTYESNYKLLFEKYNIFIELIDWLNDNNLNIIPEKTLFSAYLGISVECYNDLLTNMSNQEVGALLKNIDEYLTTSQFGALINDDRKALEKIQRTKVYGQEMQQTQPDVVNVNTTNVLTYDDIMQDIKRKRQNVIDYKE